MRQTRGLSGPNLETLPGIKSGTFRFWQLEHIRISSCGRKEPDKHIQQWIFSAINVLLTFSSDGDQRNAASPGRFWSANVDNARIYTCYPSSSCWGSERIFTCTSRLSLSVLSEGSRCIQLDAQKIFQACSPVSHPHFIIGSQKGTKASEWIVSWNQPLVKSVPLLILDYPNIRSWSQTCQN